MKSEHWDSRETIPMKKRDAILKKLGAHIAKIRKRQGYSQDRLYLEAGFSRGTMSRIEAGKVNPTYLTLRKISKTIGVPIKTLVDL